MNCGRWRATCSPNVGTKHPNPVSPAHALTGRRSRAWAIVCGALGLAGCSTVPPVPEVVRVPVPVPCLERAPERPELLTDAQLAELGDYRLVLELARDRRIRQAYEAELEAAVAGCVSR